MFSFSYTDKLLRFQSNVEIGKHLVIVEIDNLPKGRFMNLSLPATLHNPEACATLLGFHHNDDWKIVLDQEQTIHNMRKIMMEAGFIDGSNFIGAHFPTLSSLENPEVHWEMVVAPEIVAMYKKKDIDYPALALAVASAHPTVARKRLHPRAIRFIEEHWPLAVCEFRKGHHAIAPLQL